MPIDHLAIAAFELTSEQSREGTHDTTLRRSTNDMILMRSRSSWPTAWSPVDASRWNA